MKKIFLFLFFIFFQNTVSAGGRMPFLQFSMPAFLNAPVPVPRLISKSYYSDYNGGGHFASAGMAYKTYSVPTAGVQNGDLLLFVGSIDNGNDTTWPNPVSTGFTQLSQKNFGNDGQSIVVNWKIANNEPATYTGTIADTNSGSVVITLIAVSGANASSPIGPQKYTYNTGANTIIIDESSTGVTTTTANNLILFFSGADWASYPITVTQFNLPSGYTSLATYGDHGDGTLDWSSMMVAYKGQSAIGATGALTASEVGTNAWDDGIGWSAVIAIKP